IESTVDDDPARPPMVDRAAYRVVQEALTNVAKHAPGAATTVRVTRAENRTDVLVTNARPPAGPLPGGHSGRRGLIGLRERVRLLGGTLLAEPKDGGFEVAASLPHDAAPGEPPPAEDRRSESARQLERARRDVRVSLIQAIAVPAGLFGAVVAVSGIVFLVGWYGSELPGADYDRIRVGQHRAEFASLLPDQQRLSRPGRDFESPSPPRTRCEYYGTGRTVFTLNYTAYRLCFAGEKLASKDLITEDEVIRGQRDPGSAG
ncbi:ATP-binding protein, partial [Amycolatopsis sp. H20-H5]|uniref:ATP-binding protein n=1 Tax=Amycolatopsis sp. H20-H5 TaxID=3046309 RepID=UPI002DCB2397|nr:sensor histidine kinase [Amycolatopsis sp. H20-H5]